jgi:hypothetical protein
MIRLGLVQPVLLGSGMSIAERARVLIEGFHRHQEIAGPGATTSVTRLLQTQIHKEDAE